MSETKSNHKSRRKRGAQFRNPNAYKHGFYSKRLKSLSQKTLAELNEGNVEEEIQLVRTMIARHLEMRTTHPTSSAEESLTDLRVISFAVARVASLMRLSKNLPVELPDSDDWMDDLLNDVLSADSPGRSSRGFPSIPPTSSNDLSYLSLRAPFVWGVAIFSVSCALILLWGTSPQRSLTITRTSQPIFAGYACHSRRYSFLIVPRKREHPQRLSRSIPEAGSRTLAQERQRWHARGSIHSDYRVSIPEAGSRTLAQGRQRSRREEHPQRLSRTLAQERQRSRQREHPHIALRPCA